MATLCLMCLPVLAQNVVVKPAPDANAAPAPAAELVATPAPAAAVVPAPDPAAAPAAVVTPAVTVTPASAAVPDAAEDSHAQMARMQTTMTENIAKAEAADIAMKARIDTEQAGAKSDMEIKQAMMAQMQLMSDQIQKMNDRIVALTAQLESQAKPVKPVKSKPAVRPPIKPVY
jgi:hypothetical protein